MLLGGIRPILHGGNVSLQSRQRRIDAFHEVPDEAWCSSQRYSEHVVEHENLPINMRACAYTYDGNIERIRNLFSNFIGHAFEQHDIRTRAL